MRDIVSERSLEETEDHSPLVGIALSVLAIFGSVTILLYLLSYIFAIS